MRRTKATLIYRLRHPAPLAPLSATAAHAYSGRARTAAAQVRDSRHPAGAGPLSEAIMNEETFNLSVRKFLKMVGVNSQREIEQGVAKTIAAGTITGTETLAATMTLRISGLQLEVRFDGEIQLE
jgi:hypothetical protein